MRSWYVWGGMGGMLKNEVKDKFGRKREVIEV